MSDNDNTYKKNDYQKIYDDTNYFINAIITDYSFYGDFVDAVKNGSQQFDIKRKQLKKNIDEQWISAIEGSLVALDNVIRKPSKQIEERDEVLPIELSHNITSRSLRHLAQHTDYISKIEDDVITPSKILNVFHEETLLTYENKFVNTLIQRLYMFVNKRYTQLTEQGESENSVSMDFTSNFNFSGSRGKINFNVEIAKKNDDFDCVTVSERLKKLNSIVTMYLDSDFARAMGKNYVRPPIMRTNAITKNKDLKECLILWQYIESYDKVGYEIEVQESAEKPDIKYINELYSTLALQYMIFKFNVIENTEGTTEVLESIATEEPITPVFKTDLKDIEAEDYNVYDTEYRRVVPVSTIKNRKLSDGELRIREAVEIAFAADKIITERKAAVEKEKQRIEMQRIAEEKKKQVEKLAEQKKRATKRASKKLRAKKRLDETRKRKEDKRNREMIKQKKQNQKG